MDTFDWRPLQKIDTEKLRATREVLHPAIQNVAAVGRKFLPHSKQDEHATLSWVPGLSRLAGQWVKGDISFRSSISLEAFRIFLVDEKVNTLASFELEGQTHRKVMIWLEEQIGKLGLKAADLTMNLPYELPDYPTLSGAAFHLAHPEAAEELSKFYHNAYISLKEIKQQFDTQEVIHTWPHHFDQALQVIIKDSGDPETNTRLLFGMSPGDSRFENPYFYVSSWPFTETSICKKLSNNAIWVSDDWTGAVLLSRHIYNGDQKAIVDLFYREVADQLVELLTK